jgi:hypothetical protein
LLDADADRADLELRLIKLLIEDRARMHPFAGNGADESHAATFATVFAGLINVPSLLPSSSSAGGPSSGAPVDSHLAAFIERSHFGLFVWLAGGCTKVCAVHLTQCFG